MQIPKILILTLLKTNPLANNKNACYADFQEELNITELIDKDLHRNEQFIYDLYAVINHIGSLEFGNYYSYIKLNRENIWYEFNDIEVTELGRELLNVLMLIIYFILKSNDINDIRIYYSNFIYYFYIIINLRCFNFWK